ncbi:Hypp8066 [Branchiostoma lanceolatum]|uniref:Hypp8066 protein n=1 Tax=Branchiostoma lanceolatum TaxID=7740 RepID=A0A8J9Z583_BRALA|nr:Hypp8066 [Branchiostoma lanceolatum]
MFEYQRRRKVNKSPTERLLPRLPHLTESTGSKMAGSRTYEINPPQPDTGPDSPPTRARQPAESTDVTCEEVGKIVQITLVTLGLLAIATYFTLIKIIQ